MHLPSPWASDSPPRICISERSAPGVGLGQEPRHWAAGDVCVPGSTRCLPARCRGSWNDLARSYSVKGVSLMPWQHHATQRELATFGRWCLWRVPDSTKHVGWSL